MAPALVHFFVGASLLLLVATPVALQAPLPPRWLFWLVVVGGLWGLFPDVHHIAPVFEAELRALHRSPWIEIFAFHETFDQPAVRRRRLASLVGASLLFLGAGSTVTLAAQLRARTAIGETSVPYLVAAAIAVGPSLLVLALAVIGLL